MIKADRAQVIWDTQKKRWTVRIQVGEEVVKRSPDRSPAREAADDQLRAAAVETVHSEGFEIDPSAVTIER